MNDRTPQLPTDRVTAELRVAVESGEWQPGQQLPSIVDLAARFRTSRTTMQRAIARLADEGLLTVVRAWGTFRAES